MTFEELNEVRNLKKHLSLENKKLEALKVVIGAFPHKYSASGEGKSAGLAKSTFENFSVQLIDVEKRIEKIQEQLTEAVPRLTNKIQATFTNATEQTLLIYRYVACKFFRDIGYLMGYSESRVYQLHSKILKKVQSSIVKYS